MAFTAHECASCDCLAPSIVQYLALKGLQPRWAMTPVEAAEVLLATDGGDVANVCWPLDRICTALYLCDSSGSHFASAAVHSAWSSSVKELTGQPVLICPSSISLTMASLFRGSRSCVNRPAANKHCVDATVDGSSVMVMAIPQIVSTASLRCFSRRRNSL